MEVRLSVLRQFMSESVPPCRWLSSPCGHMWDDSHRLGVLSTLRHERVPPCLRSPSGSYTVSRMEMTAIDMEVPPVDGCHLHVVTVYEPLGVPDSSCLTVYLHVDGCHLHVVTALWAELGVLRLPVHVWECVPPCRWLSSTCGHCVWAAKESLDSSCLRAYLHVDGCHLHVVTVYEPLNCLRTPSSCLRRVPPCRWLSSPCGHCVWAAGSP